MNNDSLSVDEILERYKKYGADYEAAIQSGNSALSDKAVSAMEELFLALKDRSEPALDKLEELLEFPSEGVRLWSASHLINYREEAAKRTLDALKTSNSILGLVAEITLDKWSNGLIKY